MHDDLPFRVALVALLVLIRIVRLPRRRLIGLRASWPGFKRNPLDTVILLGWGVALMATIVVYVGRPHSVAWAHIPLPEWLRFAGLAPGLGGTALMVWADHALGKNLSITLQLKEDHSLVTSGPYRRIRHPIYAAVVLIFAALLLISANWLLGVCGLGGLALLLATRIPREERMMISRFGDRYREYMKRTGRLLPRFG